MVGAGRVGCGGAAEGGERTPSGAAYQFFPLAFRGHRPSRHLVAHALEEVLVVEGQSLGARDLSHISRRLLSVAGPTYRDQPIGVVCVLVFGAQGERRTMIEHEEAQSHPGAAIEAASALPQHDFGAQKFRERAALAARKRELPWHGEPLKRWAGRDP